MITVPWGGDDSCVGILGWVQPDDLGAIAAIARRGTLAPLNTQIIIWVMMIIVDY